MIPNSGINVGFIERHSKRLLLSMAFLSLGAEVLFSQQNSQQEDAQPQTQARNLSLSSETENIKRHEDMLREWGMPMHRRDIHREIGDELGHLSPEARIAIVDQKLRDRGFDLDSASRLVVELPMEEGDAFDEKRLAKEWRDSSVEAIRVLLRESKINESGQLESVRFFRNNFKQKVVSIDLENMTSDEVSDAYASIKKTKYE